ncbi:hypothetical protein CHGG_05989 [Chaetomium globosum CBS 148.51]|uniref:NAD-dependent epimerase/dehydratase domain-containing protein n=1 Tax=Chaetomium globosum (strain ATCC 6205 / CBS 148.51 / DSM 1962 / NBRC 6347 / NRRL 1970) TaxID=306901 RepID=Q2H5S6_CHAGB|nr:uncharacterized protein CHGG_05989 [Chaetomium globosum CBS 148.51]EAQ89370.1 hypothetical protein CHGG_05989 [Chaetomium globosum CBS 148.51]
MSKPTVLVTGSAGHLGTALMLALPELGYTPIGIDIKAGPTTTHVGSITDTAFLASVFTTHQPAHVIHAATLHKPHVDSHTKNDFIQTNIAGTLALLEAATTTTPQTQTQTQTQTQPFPSERTVQSFIFISTTSTFGTALTPLPNAPASWITETTSTPTPKNIYGTSKTAAEDLCHLLHLQTSLPTIILRTEPLLPRRRRRLHPGARPSPGGGRQPQGAGSLAYRRVDIGVTWISACVCRDARRGRNAAAEGGPRRGAFEGRLILSTPRTTHVWERGGGVAGVEWRGCGGGVEEGGARGGGGV